MKIGIIGLGFVGLCFASVLGSKGYSVIGVDSDKTKISKISSGHSPFYEPQLERFLKQALKSGLTTSSQISSVVDECSLIFITVGTPQQKNGQIDLAMVESSINEVGRLLRKTTNKPTIVIKSTVIPGTTKKLLYILEKKSGRKAGKDFGIVTNPEFLRESLAIEDTIKPHVIVLGGRNDKFMKRLKRFYQEFSSQVPIIMTNHQTAEIIKYANNSFLATKISFINQIANICEAIPGANVEDVAKTIGLDPRIGKLFLNAGPGYGGSCLPKDVKAIINFSASLGINPNLLNAVEEVNRNQLKNTITTVENAIGKIKGRRIAILGLAFKPETDDVRDSVSIKLIEILLRKGAKIIVHDPRAIENTRSIFGERISYEKSMKRALKGADCVIISTPWKQYAHFSEEVLRLMKKRVIVDCRRLLSGQKLNADYHAIGIGKS